MNKKVEELERKLKFYKISLIVACACLVSIIFQPYITNCLNFAVIFYNSLTDYQKGQLEGFGISLTIFFAIIINKLVLDNWWFKNE